MVIRHKIWIGWLSLALTTGCVSSKAVEVDQHLELARQARSTHSIVRSEQHGNIFVALPSQFGVITYEFGSAHKGKEVCTARGLQRVYYLAAAEPVASQEKRVVGAFLSSIPTRCDLQNNLLVELDSNLLSDAALVVKRASILYSCKAQNACARLGIDESSLSKLGEVSMFVRAMQQGRAGYWIEMYDLSFTTVIRVSYDSLQSDMPASVNLGYVE